MTDAFEKKVRSAVVAGWRVVLVAIGVLLIQWLAYLFLVPTRPAWLLALWGQGVEWPFLQNVWFWAMAAFKFCIWLMALLALWLTLWARQLRKTERQKSA